MKLFSLRTMALTALTASTIFTAGAVNAQNTVTVPVTATVDNAITLTQAEPMAFGTLIAINASGDQATLVLDGNNGLTPANGTDAKFTAVSGTVSAAEVEATGVSGSDMNFVIDSASLVSPTSPTDGDVLAIDQFTYSTDGGSTDNAVTLDTPFVITADGTAQTIDIGARLTTPDQADIIENAVYTGSFTLTASY